MLHSDVTGPQIVGAKKKVLGIIMISLLVKVQTSLGRHKEVGVMNLQLCNVGITIKPNVRVYTILLVDGKDLAA
jgi:hypothetical protein